MSSRDTRGLGAGLYLLSIELMDAAENGRPRSFMMARAASSAEISAGTADRLYEEGRERYPSIELIEAAEKAAPRSFT